MLCNEFSSSSDESLGWNILERALFFDCCIQLSNELSWNESLLDCNEPCFFGAVNLILEATPDFGTDAGVLIEGIERYDAEICDGENPRTTLVALRSNAADALSVVVDAGDDDATDAAFSGSGAEMVGDAVLLSSGEAILFASGSRYE
jgi:hypothetical protein